MATVSPPRPAPAASRSGTAVPPAVGLVGRIRSYSWGALLGIGAAGAFSLLLPTAQEKPWLELPLAMLCIAGGMLVERILNYFVGRQLDSWMQHRAARFEAAQELRKLARYRLEGTIDEPDARHLAALAAKRDVLGGRRPGLPRGPYKKKPRPRPHPELGQAGPALPAAESPELPPEQSRRASA